MSHRLSPPARRPRSGAFLARAAVIAPWCLLALALAAGACRSDRGRGAPADAGAFRPADAAPNGSTPSQVAAIRQAEARSPIKSDEEVMFFPTTGWLAREGDREVWKLPVHGWIYEPELDDALREAFLLGVRESLGDGVDEQVSELFEERLRGFLVDNERDKRVEIELAGEVFALPASAADGHFEGVLELPADAGRAAAAPGNVLPLRAITPPGDRRPFLGQIFLLEPRGLLFVSDIDDTVKITQVRDRKAMIANTFMAPFQAVPGMAGLYAGWIDRASGDHLHFVSSSPWQLYPALRALLDQAGFPPASFTLKRIRLKDRSVAALFADPRETKPAAIERLLEAHAERPVILVGDSGELDPEVYGEIARKHPARVAFIAIRDVTGESRSAPRYSKAFEGVPSERWQIFREPGELPERTAIQALAASLRP